MKKLFSLLLVLSMAVSLAVPAGAAEDATAATMRLESTEGTVTVKNSSGLSVKQQNKMRLYDGYSVKTAAKSYAYISLDGDKTLKLDASSEATVSKSGKKLEVVLASGSLFFNVVKPLESSESLNIRTATMVTGVRGTSACVSAPNRTQTEITLLTGRLEVTGQDSHSGQMETVEMNAGERAVVAQVEAGTSQERLEIQKLSVQETELPGFAAVEVAKDPELQSKIEAETGLSVSRIVEDAEQRLTADETAAQQAEAEVREKLEEQGQELPNTVQSSFGQTGGSGSGGGSGSSGGGSGSSGGGSGSSGGGSGSSGGSSGSSGGGSSSSGGGSGGGTTQPGGSEDPDLGSVRLDNPTPQELADAMASAVGVVDVYLTGGLTQNVPVAGVEKTMTLHTGTLTNSSVMTLRGATNTQPDAALVNQSILTVTGSLSVNGPLTNSGTLHIGEADKPGKVTVVGTYSGSGPITMAAGSTLSMNDTENTLSVTAGPGSKLEIPAWETISVLVDTVPLPAVDGRYAYTNSGTSDVTVQIRRTVPAVTHTVTIQGANFTATPAMTNTVTEGETFSFTPAPSAGYTITSVTCGGETLTAGADGKYTVGPVNSDMTVTVTTARITHNVTIEGTNFTATPAMTNTVTEGETFSFKLAPSTGYQITSVTCGGETMTADTTTKEYTIESVNADVTVIVMTELTTHTVTIEGKYFEADTGTSKTVTYGENFTFKLTPQTDYEIDTVTCGGETLTAGTDGKYTVGPVTGDTTVKVTMAQDLTTSTLDGLVAALDDPNVTTVNLTTTADFLVFAEKQSANDSNFEIPVGKTLNLTSGMLTFDNVDIKGVVNTDPGTTLKINYNSSINRDGNVTVISGGKLTVSGDLLVRTSKLNNYGTITLSGNTQFNTSSTIGNDGIFTISGTATADGGGYTTSLNNSGTMEIESGGSLTFSNSQGPLNNSGTLDNSGTLTLGNGGTLENSGELTVEEGGNLMVENGGTLTNDGTLTNNGTMDNYGTLTVNSGGTLANNSAITSSKTITNAGTVDNAGTLEIIALGTLTSSGTLNNSGTLTVNGSDLEVSSGGKLTVEDGGALTLKGSAVMTMQSNGILKVNGNMSVEDTAQLIIGTDTEFGTMAVSGTLTLKDQSRANVDIYGNVGVKNGGSVVTETGTTLVSKSTIGVDGGGTLRIGGSFTQEGTLNIGADGGTATVEVSGPFTRGSGSQLIMVSAGNTFILNNTMNGTALISLEAGASISWTPGAAGTPTLTENITNTPINMTVAGGTYSYTNDTGSSRTVQAKLV